MSQKILTKKKSNKTSNSRKITRKKLKSRTPTKRRFISKQEYDDMEYPYYSMSMTLKEVKQNLKSLSEYHPRILRRNPTKIKINQYRDKYVIFSENYFKNKDLYQITDYFSQTCRVQCVYHTKNYDTGKNILKMFQERKSKIYQKLHQNDQIKLDDVREYIWQSKDMKECTNFNTTVVVSLLKFFQPKNYLDFSAGWGDRLVGAIAYGKCKYTGVDPSQCMNPLYHKIINTLVKEKYRDNYQIIQSGFETATIKENHYDFIFTSPPFFDLEIYEDVETQSIQQFNTLEKWINGFLYPSLMKCYKSLTINGKLALYIADYTEHNYVELMKKYIKTDIPGFEYEGDVHWWTQGDRYKIRKIFVWKKIN